MKRGTIFFDLDGVVANWLDSALNILNLENNLEVRNFIKSGGKLEDRFPEIYDELNKQQNKFWNQLDVYSWSYDIVNSAKKYGQIAFLTSSGNIYRNIDMVANASKGKCEWVSKNFKEEKIPLIITRDKYLCAGEGKFLVDDTKEKLDKFIEYGGGGFLFPNQYKLIDSDIKISDMKKDLLHSIKKYFN